jgi:hypothetical protein
MELVDILKESIESKGKSISGIKEGIYDGIISYLGNNAVLSTRDLNGAMVMLRGQEGIRDDLDYFNYCIPSVNPWMKTSDILFKISLKEASEKVFRSDFQEYEIIATSTKTPNGTHTKFLYLDEEKMLDYVREHVKLEKKVAYFRFNPDT